MSTAYLDNAYVSVYRRDSRRMPTTTVSATRYTTPDGNEQCQYRTTVPKGLAEALGLEGEKIEWEIQSGNALTVRKVEE